MLDSTPHWSAQSAPPSIDRRGPMAFTKPPQPPQPIAPRQPKRKRQQETDLFGAILAWWRRWSRWQRRTFIGVAVVIVLMIVGATQPNPSTVPSKTQVKQSRDCEQRTY